jgi:hypothetical protein
MNSIILPNLLLAIAVVAALAAVCRLPFRSAPGERAETLTRLEHRRRPVAEREAA